MFKSNCVSESKNFIVPYALSLGCYNNSLDTPCKKGICMSAQKMGVPQTLKHSLKN